MKRTEKKANTKKEQKKKAVVVEVPADEDKQFGKECKHLPEIPVGDERGD